MNQYTIERTAKVPLKFSGKLLSVRTSFRVDSNRHTVVELYVTTAGKYVGVVSNFDSEKPDYPRIRAEFFDEAARLIDWLKNDGTGTLGRLAVGCLKDAGEQNAALKAAFMEVVP